MGFLEQLGDNVRLALLIWDSLLSGAVLTQKQYEFSRHQGVNVVYLQNIWYMSEAITSGKLSKRTKSSF